MKYVHILAAVLITVTIGAADAADPGADKGGDMLGAGDNFAQFRLEAHDGSEVRSSELAGTPYLIYFYPKADTPGCTKEACALRDSWSELESLGVKVFGVSYDSPKSNRAFAEKFNLPFLLLSDEDKTLAKEVGASQMLMPFPKRISYLVGADGVILKAYPKVSPAEHAAEVIRDFKKLSGTPVQ